MEGNAKISSAFFMWWYGDLFHRLLAFFKQFFIYLADLFSVRICLVTILAPWKRDKISYEGLSIREKLEVATLNLSSRIIGAFIKLFTLFTFVIAFIISILITLLVIAIWFLYPLVLIGMAVWGIKIMISG